MSGELQFGEVLDQITNFEYHGADYRFGCGALYEAPRAPSRIEGCIHSNGESKDVRLMQFPAVAASENTVTRICRCRLLYAELLTGCPSK